ncbi:AMP-binding protein [Caenimonas aquaedulcis]|uniref:AMP-binding protein n=1 Tax=Caenimonas aquaedulcis TaxID=2793270 RepID=A0A931H3P8_9BURK|nr:AMP-binding protein [Caenimonas aquaedulcis]MBG9387989.1 AMP-binding protein [Caenimonas aquaedulcis]
MYHNTIPTAETSRSVSVPWTAYFPKRTDGDQLDVVALLQQGLARGSERCVIAYEGEAVTAGQMRTRVAQVQAQLRGAGIGAGDRVAVMMSNSVEHVALIYALILSGAVWIPVNVRLRGAGLDYIVRHSRPALLVFDAEFEEVLASLSGVKTLRLQPGANADAQAQEMSCNRDIRHGDPLCIIYTSGTTGAPKGVVFTHRMLRIASEAALMVAGIRDKDRAFLWEPLCHIGGAQMLMLPFLVDAQLHVVKRFSASRFWAQWRTAGATHLHYLGGVLDVLMQLPQAGDIRVAWGAGVSVQAWGPIRARFGCELRECYGMTECSSFATLNASGTPGSIGAALPWIGIELLDAESRPVPSGDIGEMVLSSDVEGVFLPAYLDNPEATASALRGGKLHTGDLARQLPHGEYAFVGRRTDSMRVRGENVSAWEVERVFALHPAIKTAAVVGVPAAIGEQDILMYVEFESGAAVEWGELVAWAQPRLADFQLPRYYASVDRFELTPSERIRKHLLPRDAAGAWDRTLSKSSSRSPAHVQSR